MKKRGLFGLSVATLALVCSGITFGTNMFEKNDGGIFIQEKTDEKGPMFYAADYSTDIEDEPYYEEQNTKTFSLMNFSKAPNQYRGDSVKVAVIDSGINYSHEDFGTINANSGTIDNISGAWSYYSYESDESKLNDTMGHGTNVASVIASQINSVGCAGIAPNVDLYIYKVTNSEKGYEWRAINDALQYCIDNDIDVINMSFQAYEHPVTYNSSSMGASIGCSTVLKEMLKKCHDNGITLVGAAGNYNTSEPSYPASNDHVISVGSLASGSTTQKAGFSNTYGIDLVAPGYVQVADKGSTNAYKENHGTSFSAPIVTAAIALYKQKNPDATPSDIEKVLYATCDSISGDPTWAGHGRLNIDRFLGLDGTSPQSISIDNIPSKEIELEVGDKLQLEYSVLPTTFEGTMEFSTFESGAISVSNTGLVTALEKGEDIVSINPVRYAYINDEISISVKEREKPEEVNVISTSIAKSVSNGDQVVWGMSNTNCIKSIESNWGYLSNDETEFMVFSVETATGGFYLKSNNKYVYSNADKKISLTTSKTLLSINSTTGLITGKNGTTSVGTYVVNGNVRPYTSLGSYTNTYLYKVTKTSADTEYTVDFDPKGGSMGANPIGKKAYMGASITLPSIEKGGYTFAGWSTSSNATSVDYNANYSLRITSNTKLYAVWVSNVADYIQDDYGSYYPSILESLSGDSLLSELHKLNNDKRIRTMGYDGLKTYGRYTEKDWTGLANKSGKMFGFYDNAYISDYWDDQATWNREHVWPNSLGGNKVDNDMHMVRPASVSINSSRGNKFYGKNIYDPGQYEENYRGVAARIIFYSAIASTDLKLSDGTSLPSNSNTMGKLSDLLEWNLQYLPNRSSNAPLTLRIEQNRNKEIFSRNDLQGNRNPFIDHPEYACKIWGNTNASTKEICAIGQQVTLSSISLSGNFQTSFNIGETFNYDNLVVTATYSDGSSKEVTPSSVSTPIMTTAGEKTVTVKYSENDDEVSSSYNINVKSSGGTTDPEKHTTSLSLDETTAIIKVGETTTLVATKTPSDSVDGINWSTSDPSVATVVNGVVTGVSVGTATITATSNDIPATCSVEVTSQSSSNTVTASIDFTNSNNSYKDSAGNIWTGTGGTIESDYYRLGNSTSITSSSISIDTSKTIDLSLYIGSYGSGTKTLSAYAINSSGTVVTNQVSMSPTSTGSNKFTGTLTFNNTSDSNIKIVFKTTSGSIRFYKGDITYTPLPIGPQVTSISLSESELTFDLYNDSSPKTLTATIEADEGADKTIAWTSSNEAVATVVDGVVIPHSEGNATITATSKANPEVKDTCTVSVADTSPKPVTGIALNETSLQLVIGSNFTLVCTFTPTNATNKNVTWSSSDESVATVSDGVVTSKAVGSATITVTTADGGFTATCTINVSATPEITYKLEADQETVPYMSGTNHQVSVGVKLYEYSKGVKGSPVASSTGSVDTSVLGPAKISYTYQSVTYETSVKVTNNGAKIGSIPDVKASGENFSNTMPDNWSSNGCGQYATNNAPYLLKMDTTGDYFEYLPKNFSSNSKTINANVTLKMIGGASSSSFTVYALVKDGSGTIVTSSNIKSTISISGKQNDVKTNLSCTLNNSNGDTIYGIRYVFTKGSNVGVSSAEITFKGAQGDATSQEQAVAWSNYFIKLTGGGEFDGPCKLGTPEAKKAALQQVWGELKSEYVYMVEDSKTAFCSADATETIAKAVQHYRYIVNTYGLEDFAEVPQVSNSNIFIPINDSKPFIIGVIAMVGLASIGAYFVYKKRREE